MNNTYATIMILCVCIGLCMLVGVCVYIFLILISNKIPQVVIVEQKNERTIATSVVVEGMSAFIAQSFQGDPPYSQENKEFGKITDPIAKYLRVHPNDVIYTGSANTRRRKLLTTRFIFSYQFDIERVSENRLVSEINTTAYNLELLRIFRSVSTVPLLDNATILGKILVTDYVPPPTTTPAKIITQELTIEGLTPQDIEKNKQSIVENLAKKLGVNAADIKITGVSSRRRRLLSGTTLIYTIAARVDNYEDLIDNIESSTFKVGIVNDLADATGVNAEDLTVESKKVIAENFEAPLICEDDCDLLSSTCLQGTCEEGECITIPRNQGIECEDNNVCTKDTTCNNGICLGLPVSCYDNNPCTIDKCIDGIGCMEQQQSIEGSCIPGCLSDNGCPVNFICHDGTCLNINYEGILFIRFINYEIQNCQVLEGVGHRLLMSFIMDAEKHTVGIDEMYRVASSKTDISALRQPLGFVDEVVDINIIQIDNIARSAFTLATECQTITVDNCQTIFADRRFEFSLNVKDCKDINKFPAEGCLDPQSHVSAHIALSLSDCTVFPTDIQNIKMYGSASIYYEGVRFEGVDKHQIRLSNDKTIRLALDTQHKQFDVYRSIFTNIRACIADPQHRLSHCVSNSTGCFNKGCFNWAIFDSPLMMKYDFMENGYVTALAMSSFAMKSCYKNFLYHETDEKICQADNCDPEDYVDIRTDLLPENTEIVFDLIYKHVDCVNYIVNEKEQYHHMVSVEFI